jgi:xanthine dehydrogenase YagS FAD-binding subunit
MENFSLAMPATIEAALAAAQQADAKFIAGGTDLMQLMKDHVERPQHLVDLEGLPLDTFSIGGDGARIGALVRMSDLADDPDLRRRYPVVAEALLASASPQVRNMATMGGNVLQRTRCGYFRDTGFACNKRVPGSGCPAIHGENRMLAILGGSEHCIATHASDLAVALVALDAIVEIHGPNGMRRIDIGDLHRPPGDTPHVETNLQPGEMITMLEIPASALARRSHYLKVRDRASFEFALVSAAVALDTDGEVIRDARVAMGGVGTKPWRLPAVEMALRGQPISAATFAAAASAAPEGAIPSRQNGFKVNLMQRTLVRALQNVAA